MAKANKYTSSNHNQPTILPQMLSLLTRLIFLVWPNGQYTTNLKQLELQSLPIYHQWSSHIRAIFQLLEILLEKFPAFVDRNIQQDNVCQKTDISLTIWLSCKICRKNLALQQTFCFFRGSYDICSKTFW